MAEKYNHVFYLGLCSGLSSYVLCCNVFFLRRVDNTLKVPLLKNISRSLQVAAVISQASSIFTRRGDWSLWELGATSKRGQADASAVSTATFLRSVGFRQF